MNDHIFRFHHEGIDGAVIRVLEDEILSVNEFLSEDHQHGDTDEYAFAYTSCYLNVYGRHVLIDAGFDPDTVPGALESIDVLPEDINWVLLTHADRDHVGGLLMGNGSLTYPNAQHVIGKALWEDLSNPETLAALSDERSPFFRRLVAALDSRLQLCEGEELVTADITFLLSSGHRLGHAVYEIKTQGTPLVHTGDSYFHPLFIESPAWINRVDSLPDVGSNSRQRLTERLAQTAACVLGSHLPFPGIGTILRDGSDYRWVSRTEHERPIS